MSKVFVEFQKMYNGNTTGDCTAIEYDLYKELEAKGIVKQKNILCKQADEVQNIVLDTFIDKNIKGENYIKGMVDIVVLTRNKSDVKCLVSNEKHLMSYEIIESDFKKTGKGFASNCNLGAGINKKLGEFILFLNDDVIINDQNNFLKDIIEPFKDKKVGMVGANCSQTSFGINGAVMCIRRELFEALGGFDENYFFMWEDNDMCINMTKRGYKIAISKANVSHNGKDSVNTQSEFWRKYYYLGKSYFEKKWNDDKRIIGSLIVGDENDRYMTEIILDLFKRDLINELVVVCDNSNIETINELENIKKYLPITIFKHDFKLFGKAENILRERSINYAMSFNPYAIIPIDADEILDEELNRKEILNLIKEDVGIDFYIAHFYNDKDHVRIDGVFAHQKNVRLFRVLWGESTKFYNKNLHCGSAPIYAYSRRKLSKYYFRHYGYINKQDIEKKRIRQQEFDKNKLLENSDLYDRMVKEDVAEVIPFNKLKFIEIWNK